MAVGEGVGLLIRALRRNHTLTMLDVRRTGLAANTAGKQALGLALRAHVGGALPPDGIHVPGIYVDRIIVGSHEKRIEKRTTRAA